MMTKPTFETANLTDKNIEKIAKLFPNVITEVKDEGKSTPEKTIYKKGINFELLKQELSGDVVDGDECYDFNWVGKKACILEGNKPIRETLRPCLEESKDWEHTGNLYIEGDNLDVLKLLQESYLNSVKMIYIDPPYNTGNDSFIYPDNFTMDKDDYEEQTEYRDDDNNINFKQNNAANPRFHSDWCSMMYPRLKLAQNLLTDDGVIFISIDDNEVYNLRKMCDEVFGESNFVAQMVWEKKKKGSFLANSITNIKEYIIAFAKDINTFQGLIGEIKTSIETYPCINASNKRELRIIPKGIISKYKEKNFFMAKGSKISDTTMDIVLNSDLVIKNSVLAQNLIIEGNWRYSQEAMTKYANNKEIYITQDLYLRRIVSDARYKTLKDILPRVGINDKAIYNSPLDFNNLFSTGWGSNEDADEELRLIFGVQKLLDYPKPTRLLIKLIASLRDKQSVILDFFSGSATTAHAVMQLNAEDGGNRKFIMVQLPEPCNEKSEAYKAGYKNICEIGKERIRRAGEKIKATVEEENAQLKLDEEPKKVPDIGFRVLKVDSTNMKKVYYSPEDYTQEILSGMESNIKEDRTDLDLLYGVLLDWGLELTKNHKIVELYGVRVHCYDFDETKSEDISNAALIPNCSLVACFADKVSEKVICAIAKSRPLRAVFRDSSFTDCPEKINVEEIFKYYAPDTSVKVI